VTEGHFRKTHVRKKGITFVSKENAADLVHMKRVTTKGRRGSWTWQFRKRSALRNERKKKKTKKVPVEGRKSGLGKGENRKSALPTSYMGERERSRQIS